MPLVVKRGPGDHGWVDLLDADPGLVLVEFQLFKLAVDLIEHVVIPVQVVSLEGGLDGVGV